MFAILGSFLILMMLLFTERNMKRMMRSGVGNIPATLMKDETVHLVNTVLAVTRVQRVALVNIVIVGRKQGWNQQRNLHLFHQPIIHQIMPHLVINM